MKSQAEEIRAMFAKQGMGAIQNRRVWTNAYRPFIMGGDVHGPIGAEVPVMGPFDGGKGFSLFIALSPKNSTHIVDAASGAFVGTDLQAVCKDIKEGDVKVMKQQVSEARERRKKVSWLTAEEFWHHFRK